MTNKETVEHNIDLLFDFLRQVIKDPSVLDTLPDGSTLELERESSPKRKKGKVTARVKALKE